MVKYRSFFVVIAQMILLSCGSDKRSESSSDTSPELTVQKVDLIIDVKSLIGKSLKDIEIILGKSESTEKVSGYPCENATCTKSFFNHKKYEILFKNKLVNRITINSVPNLTNEDNAIEALGLKAEKYSFKNPDTVIRWNNINGIEEISFNYDFIYIIASKN